MSHGSSRDPPDNVLPAFFCPLVSTPVACRRSRGPRAHTIADWLSSCCGGVQYGGRRWRPDVSATVLWGAARSGVGGGGGSGWDLQTETEALTFSAYYLRTPPPLFQVIVNGKQGNHSRRRAVLWTHDMGVPLRRLRAPSPETDIRNGRLARLGPDVPQWLLSRPRCAPSSCRVQAWGGGIGFAQHRDPPRSLRQVLCSAQEGGTSRSDSLSVGHYPAPPLPHRGRTHPWRSARPAPAAPPRASTSSPPPLYSSGRLARLCTVGRHPVG